MSQNQLSQTLSGPTVLLVDDDEDSRFVFGLGLEHAGFRVLLAADGESGLSLARERRPDVIVLDVELPTMDGCEVMRRLRAEAAQPQPAIVAVTAHTLADNGSAMLADGFDRVLLKPVEPATLVATLLRTLAERRAVHAAPAAGEGETARLANLT